MQTCTQPGCHELVKTGRCDQHRRAKDRARGTREQRGYGAEHVKLRRRYQARMDAGVTYQCWRCGETIDPNAWDLGHADRDRNTYRGPECRGCNRATAGRG